MTTTFKAFELNDKERKEKRKMVKEMLTDLKAKGDQIDKKSNEILDKLLDRIDKIDKADEENTGEVLEDEKDTDEVEDDKKGKTQVFEVDIDDIKDIPDGFKSFLAEHMDDDDENDEEEIELSEDANRLMTEIKEISFKYFYKLSCLQSNLITTLLEDLKELQCKE